MRLQGAALLLALALAACSSAEWHGEVYDHLTVQDVFEMTQYSLGSDYAIRTADPIEGRIETQWEYNAISPDTRLPARERVVAEVRPVEEGVELRLRVQRQARDERVGMGLYDEESEDWEDIADDPDRAAVIFQKIRTVLVKGRPSDEFLRGYTLPEHLQE